MLGAAIFNPTDAEGEVEPSGEDVLTVLYWREEPDYEDAWWWDDDYEPTEEP